ncbi:MAG: polyprenyl synthetase family protein [candidate division Zixibacteria bacterium]|nr:polyprenyl synthetase family protein [Gammaproteobacteria bacterium]NIX56125.1 polyprenyl synthetase family protein [candidate division Zixibacteria bacterium]
METINFFDFVHEQIPLVEDRMREQSNGHHPDLEMALHHLLSSGGKRVRPTVTLLVGGMLGAEQKHVITLAAAVELLHTATLVHDDVIDGSLLRRGSPTLNARWSPGATILTGDFIFARAAKLAAETESIDVMKLFAKTLSTIVNGEITQLFISKGLVNREDYYQRIYAKTASLFELCTIAPVFLSGEDRVKIKYMQKFGYEVGMAFQIVDDILDFTSDQTELGKPVANDLRQGLVTLPALHYLEKNPDDPDMKSVVENRIVSEEAIIEVVNAIRESGAIESAMNEAIMFIERALSALSHFPESAERRALEALAKFVVSRQI